jgi:molecular chaperone DnaK
MSGRLAIDFGTSNTVLAVWDETRRQGAPYHLPDYARQAGQVSIVPSLIHYAPDRRRWVGDQVLEQGLYDSPRTFRWMKRYISHRSPIRVRLEDHQISHFEAGRDFLVAVLSFAAADLGLSGEEIAFTVPVEAFEHYEEWLAGVAEAAGMPRFRLIDEASAAALGYGAHIQPGDCYLIFDFGGGTLDVAAVLIEEEMGATSGRRCRVLGKAGTDIGGAVIDQWLFQETLRQNHRGDTEDEVRTVSRALLVACERAKEQLSEGEHAEVVLPLPGSDASLCARFTRGQLEDLLDQHEAFTRLDQTIRRALGAARERGYQEDSVRSVLMVGGSSQIPAVQRAVQRIFGRDRVMLHRPLDAVARGAAAFVGGVDFYDHIQHDYAVRWYDPQAGDYDYRVIVQRGTPYPTEKPVARLTVKATHSGQEHLGLAIFELGERRERGQSQPVELVFDPSGAARVVRVDAEEEDRRARFWLNEQSPTFLAADPPAAQGEPRFQVEFGIDANKRLVITARDLVTGRTTHQDHPVVRLT